MGAARLIQVIETEELRGKGVAGDPHRRVVQYYSIEGALLAEHDSWKVDQEIQRAIEVKPGIFMAPTSTSILR